jgi:predicted PurR-regulated permease PerM
LEETERPSRLPSLGPPGSRRRRAIFFAVCGALLVSILVVFRGVLTPFAVGLVLAYVLAPLAHALTRLHLGRFRLPKWAAVIVIYVCLLGGLGTAIAFGAPRVVVEAQRVAREAPRTLHTVQDEYLPRIEEAMRRAARFYATPEDEPPVAASAPPEAEPDSIRVVPQPDGGYEVHLPSNGITVAPSGENEWRIQVAENPQRGPRDLNQVIADAMKRAFSDTERLVGAAFRHVQTFTASLVGGIFTFFITLMISAYILITSDRILAFFRSLARPAQRARFDDLVDRIDRGLAGVVRGQLLIACVNGVMSGIGFWIADLSYWPLLTVIATLLSIIPIFGAIISSVPAVLVGLHDGLGTALFVLAWIVGVHQLEANVLNPKIMGDAAKVHPVLVVFALLAGEHLFGIVGALLAVPLLSITQSIFLHFREVALGVPRDAGLTEQWAESTLDRPPGDA